ncbi:MAG: hypothetical protein IJG23_06355, partial [Clostridia bacterium]|nr:hypothetical protein [Clostridia bacterium]
MEEKYQYAVQLIKNMFKAENNSPFIIGISVVVLLMIAAAFIWRKVQREKFDKFLTLVRKFAISKYFMILCVGLACLVVTLHIEVGGAVMFLLIESILLLFCRDIMVTTLPFMLTCVFLCKMYDSFSTFIKLWPVAIGFILVLIGYIAEMKLGKNDEIGERFAQTYNWVGLLTFFIAMWIISFWGFDLSYDHVSPSNADLWFANILFIASSIGAMYYGAKNEHKLFFNYGLIFLIIET